MKASQPTTGTVFLTLVVSTVLFGVMYVGSYFVWVKQEVAIAGGSRRSPITQLIPAYQHTIKTPQTRAVAVSRFIRSVYKPIHYVDAAYLRPGFWRPVRRIDPDSVGGQRHLYTAPRVD